MGRLVCSMLNLDENWSKMINKNIDSIQREEKDDEFISLFELKQFRKIIKNIIIWGDTHFDDVWFFPSPNDDDFQLKRSEISRRIYNYCAGISWNLFSENSLELTAPPKYIAAASMIDPISRPFFPTGRLLHSIYYTESNYSQTRKDILKAKNKLQPAAKEALQPPLSSY